MSHATVVAGGAAESLPRPDGAKTLVIAADSGLDACNAAGLVVDVLVGDLDSVSSKGLRRARATGVEVIEHPTDKDHTDLELALHVAYQRGCSSVDVFGIGGGRIDHLLGNIAALIGATRRQVDVVAHFGAGRAWVLSGHGEVAGEPGDLVSLLPLAGAAGPITTSGLEYPLSGDVLEPWEARGISNVLTEVRATVDCEKGYLLVVHQPPEQL